MDAQLPSSHICSLRGRQGQTPNPSPDGGVPLLRSLQQPTPSMAGPAALTPASASTHAYASSSTTRMSRSSLRLTGRPPLASHMPHARFPRLSPNAPLFSAPSDPDNPGQSWARGPGDAGHAPITALGTHGAGVLAGPSAALPVSSPSAGPGSSELEAPAPSPAAPPLQAHIH